MNIHLAVLLPFLCGLGACMMPAVPRGAAPQQGQSGSQPGAVGAGTIGAPPESTPSPSDPSGSGPSQGSGPAAAEEPSAASVTIRSSCPKTVKVFYGNKPKFGSGTYSSVESNSVSNHTFNIGDMFWIVDDSENGVASVTVNRGTSEIDVGSDCAHLSAH